MLKFSRLTLLVAVILPLPSWSDPLSGPSFVNDGKVVTMPDEWVAKGITRQDWAANADLAVTLDQQLYPALLPMIQEYARKRHLNIAVQEGTCGISAGKLESKNADMGGFCCPPGASDRLPGLKYHTLAIGSLAILTHPNNPVTDLTADQVRSVFGGSIARWQELPGGEGFDELIRVVGRLHCKARPGHWRLILDQEDLFSPRMDEVSTIPDMLTAVQTHPEAIGYETLWMVNSHHRDPGVKLLSIGGVAPTDSAALAAGRYPFYRVFNISTWEGAAANPQSDALAKYLLQNSEQLDPRFGFVPHQRLREAGWQFTGNELTAEPGGRGLATLDTVSTDSDYCRANTPGRPSI